MEKARASDDHLANLLNSDLDPLLIFVWFNFYLRLLTEWSIIILGIGRSILSNSFGISHRSSEGSSRRPPENY